MIKVKNWSTFQHYKDRNPPWIKLSTTLFQDYDFASMSDASKLLAICIWTLASRYKDPLAGLVPNDIRWIKSQCNLGESITEKTLQELVSKGFIEIASNKLADCLQSAIPETETETETDNKIIARTSKKKIQIEKPSDVSDKTWAAFIEQRKAKKAPINETVLQRIRKEAMKANWSMEDALQETCMRGWQGFKAEWVQQTKGSYNGKSTQQIIDEVAAEYYVRDEQEDRTDQISGGAKLQHLQPFREG
jgi:hypothetical protein